MIWTLDILYNGVAPLLTNVPIYFSVKGSIAAVFLLVYYTKCVHFALSFILNGDYDMVQASYRAGKGPVNESWKSKAVQRAFGVHENTWEAFISFSAAILLALVSGVSAGAGSQLEKSANDFIFVRLVYSVVYWFGYSQSLAVIRSGVFMVGLAILLHIFSLAVGGVILR